MAVNCPLRRGIENKTVSFPSSARDRELELVAIIAEAELAFDKVNRACADIAA